MRVLQGLERPVRRRAFRARQLQRRPEPRRRLGRRRSPTCRRTSSSTTSRSRRRRTTSSGSSAPPRTTAVSTAAACSTRTTRRRASLRPGARRASRRRPRPPRPSRRRSPRPKPQRARRRRPSQRAAPGAADCSTSCWNCTTAPSARTSGSRASANSSLPCSPATGGRAGLRLLDCGCGTGHNLALLKEYGEPFGFDVSDAGLNWARAAGRPLVRPRSATSRLPTRALTSPRRST